VLPNDHKSKTLLMGRYMEDHSTLMLIEPKRVIKQVLQRVFDVQNLALLVLLGLLIATFGIAMLVFVLSIRLRRGEIETVAYIGASKWRVRMLLMSEIIVVVGISILLVLVSLILINFLGTDLIYYLI